MDRKTDAQTLVPVKRERTTLAHTDAPVAFRDEMFALAGETKTTMAKRTRRALDVIDEAMEATKVTHHTYQGEVVEESIDIDHGTRIAAADRHLDIIGARVSKSSSTQAPSGPSQVVVVIERAEVPQRVQAEVIEASPASS